MALDIYYGKNIWTNEQKGPDKKREDFSTQEEYDTYCLKWFEENAKGEKATWFFYSSYLVCRDILAKVIDVNSLPEFFEHSECDGGFTTIEVSKISNAFEKVRTEVLENIGINDNNERGLYDLMLDLFNTFKIAANNNWEIRYL